MDFKYLERDDIPDAKYGVTGRFLDWFRDYLKLSGRTQRVVDLFTLYRITLRPTQKPYRIGLLFTYEMLLSSQFLPVLPDHEQSSQFCELFVLSMNFL